MKCPVCKDSNLLMTDRQGIEIDYCGECRGVWLDRGELDKIIEKSNNNSSNTQKNDNRDSGSDHEKRNSSDNYRNNEYSQHNDQNKKKGGFLGDLLDF